jgi:hypothetical protein
MIAIKIRFIYGLLAYSNNFVVEINVSGDTHFVRCDVHTKFFIFGRDLSACGKSADRSFADQIRIIKGKRSLGGPNSSPERKTMATIRRQRVGARRPPGGPLSAPSAGWLNGRPRRKRALGVVCSGGPRHSAYSSIYGFTNSCHSFSE